MATSNHEALHVEKFQAPQGLKTLAFALMALGALTFGVGMKMNPDRVWTSYLAAFFFFSCLGLGGLFFTAIQHVAKAGWSVGVRRYAEAMTSFIPFILVFGLLLLLGAKHLYSWTNPEVLEASPAIKAKTAYLNMGFMTIRLVVFAGAMMLFKWFIVGNSLNQDKSGDHSLTLKNVGLSIAFILVFAVGFSLFSVDFIMSLLPTWASTIFGVYCFAGLFQATFAALTIMIVVIKRAGLVKGYVTEEHQHDIAKFMKGFTVFWAYIAFSQFMLMWYANIPEETEYYLMRSANGWWMISFLLLALRFIVPFLTLLPRGNKRNDATVVGVAVLILIMQYVDIYWLIYPNFNGGHMAFGFWEIGMFAGFAGLFLYGIISFFTKFSMIPLKDPRLHEATSHHVAY